MRPSILLSPLALALFALAGCGVDDPSGIGKSASAIIGGAADPGDPAVMLLVSYPPDDSVLDECTAVLIAPSVLATAAHCVDAPSHPNYVFGVFPGADGTAVAINQLLPVTEVQAHPQYDANDSANDIGIVVLSVPLAVSPLPVNRAPLTQAQLGTPLRIIGYGRTDYNVTDSAGAKHQATTILDSFDAATAVVGDPTRHTCEGDSGSPALLVIHGEEMVIGVDSHAPTGCTGPSTYTRLDAYLDFLTPWLPAPPDLGSPADLSIRMTATDLAMVNHPEQDASEATREDASRTASMQSGGCSVVVKGAGSGEGFLGVLMAGLLALRFRTRRGLSPRGCGRGRGRS